MLAYKKIIVDEVRFPSWGTQEKANSDVREYMLSQEELAKYRAMKKPTGEDAKQPFVPRWGNEQPKKRISNYMKRVSPDEFTKEQYLKLKKHGFSDKQIWTWLETHHTWMLEKKREWGLLGHKVDRKRG